MGFSVKVLADSIGESGVRLTTVEATYPRIIHSELLTHGMLSRNSASSRAIPALKLIQRVVDDPFVPEHIGKNQKGMQASEQLDDAGREAAVAEWLAARDSAVAHARRMVDLGVHKQVVNRIIEPWMWITVIITATDLNNLWALRDHEKAEPHFQKLARMWKAAIDASTPKYVKAGDWHLPLIYPEDVEQAFNDIVKSDSFLAPVDRRLAQISIGRCARVSYLTHDGKRDHAEDIRLFNDLMGGDPKHASPAEHAAMALPTDVRVAKLRGWCSYRMMVKGESVPG